MEQIHQLIYTFIHVQYLAITMLKTDIAFELIADKKYRCDERWRIAVVQEDV